MNSYRFSDKPISVNRIVAHVAFWVVVWLFTSFVYGYNKQDFGMALENNLSFLPIHILYFYTVAYFLPRFLFNKQYFIFFFLLLLCVFILIPLLTRLMDVFVVEPKLDAYLKSKGYYKWDKVTGTIWERLTNADAYLSAFKGANLVVWVAIAIRSFKLWYERHHAALQAELNFLKGQIHPHFLFNTLNNLYALTLSNSPKSPNIVMGLSEILRYMLYECNVERVALKKDVEVLESYILIEKIRYEERLDLSFTKTGNIDVHQIAPLLLLPLVENAFKHGASEKVGEAWVSIDLSVKDNLLKFKVGNSKAETIDQMASNHYGKIGLENVRKRLQIIYPNAHELKVFNEEEMFVAILEINLDKMSTL
ncbi:sensor histidine kinase [Pedobacter sp. Hv1]|uniref:sensor histidine kinase n=1 Tax=Pedobacter sp. Hv1 TaxID=1740090 RepID=UPI0006D8CF65|nr:histidine kinase [Pedobacter sp. Hv1]KQC02487.1 histidine kinase [Pedobacter sp. Hv1]